LFNSVDYSFYKEKINSAKLASPVQGEVDFAKQNAEGLLWNANIIELFFRLQEI
jgi:hypothetical protein